ncbi:MAG: cell division protein ZapA [Magnetococcales bacterium]|nr:cell division protein ZapA [Magnetococcales bacterium]
MSESIEIRIRGQAFKLKSQGSGEYVRELAQYVNDVMAQMSQGSQAASNERTAIMAALRIADDFLQHRRLVTLQTETANEKISNLIAQSDQLLKG